MKISRIENQTTLDVIKGNIVLVCCVCSLEEQCNKKWIFLMCIWSKV